MPKMCKDAKMCKDEDAPRRNFFAPNINFFCAEFQNRGKRASPSLQRRRCTTLQLFFVPNCEKGKGKSFPHLCKDVDAPRLIFFVSNCKEGKGKSFPHLCKDVDAPRLIFFVPNCKKGKGKNFPHLCKDEDAPRLNLFCAELQKGGGKASPPLWRFKPTCTRGGPTHCGTRPTCCGQPPQLTLTFNVKSAATSIAATAPI